MTILRPLLLASAAALALGGQALVGSAQQAPAAAMPANPLDSLYFRPIGPASMSGRVADLAVHEANPSTYYVGTAHGGVWKTTNNGTTFQPQLQAQGLMSIGDVTISQTNPDLVWVGTGESSNRQSTSWGDGVYKSTDGGKTYTNMGLRASKHINRIVIDPANNDTVFVAATGSLWGSGGERGVYKTTDGGKTWNAVLTVNDDTGANDLIIDPANSRVLYATMYQRRRTACCFNGGGAGSGIWKSTDAGETWTRLKGGVLDGPLGRIAIEVYRKDPNILYALIEGPQPPQAGGRQGGAPSVGLDTNPTGLYKSTDAGATWTKVNNANPRPMYFSQITIDPNDASIVYLGGVGLHQTLDGGKTVATDVAASTHDDVHAIWVNPSNSSHVLIGNDGGLAVSYDRAKTWAFLPNLPVGLFYHVSVDMAMPYNVCGGMQDNYNWCGPSAVRGAAGIAGFHWATLLGGDGFVVLQDPTDYRIAYTESQDGNIVRVDRVTGETISIRPQPAPGEAPYRWHWDTPLVMSSHNPSTIFSAANKVFRSTDRGLSWVAISPELTESPSRDEVETMGVKNTAITFSRNDGIGAWPTIVSLAESPTRAGLIYAGTDDGNVSVTRDGGAKWENLTSRIQGIPKSIYVSEVVPSRFDEGVVYATFDGHRQNDFGTHIYASSDYGQTWRAISSNLRDEVARTLTEDTRNPDVLYLGTETGLFVSLNRGREWQRIKANLPTVRIDEITLHPRDNAMILATHGRTIWILDHLEPIQELAAATAAMAGADLFTPPPFAWYQRPARDRNYEFWGDQTFYGQNPPQAVRLSWYLPKPAGTIALKIADETGADVRTLSGAALTGANKAGVNVACWDLRVAPVAAAAPTADTGRQGGA
ncbi:MAG: glycosyl hydrolase, partial [Acidobacteriota bacterium]|nr:glycosyl hydrolase [Acidobacteriota bacterium]